MSLRGLQLIGVRLVSREPESSKASAVQAATVGCLNLTDQELCRFWV